MDVSWLAWAKVMEVRENAFWNAELPMLVTLVGMATEVSPAPKKAEFPMLVTPDGITTAPTQLLPAVTTPLVIV